LLIALVIVWLSFMIPSPVRRDKPAGCIEWKFQTLKV
jgi:hypothetical protein